jgi:hypothetical protein
MRIAHPAMVLALVLAACGRSGAAARIAATATATRTPVASGPAAPAPPKLLYAWRNFELTGIPEELTIYRDGALRYRNVLHTQTHIALEAGRQRPVELLRVRRLLRRTEPAREDASGVKPRRSGFRYIIRAHGAVGTAADGHLRGPVRALVAELARLMDRLRDAR